MTSVSVSLRAEPAELTMPERHTFRLSLDALNPGDRTVDPRLHRARLLVNGHESTAWSLAVGNGRRPPEWTALPPGERVTMTWSALAAALFPRPGTYDLVLTLDETETPAVRVVVRD
ncbi:hypothetical protein Afil01_40590 [Actinorhabdospora filicis]|uniref:Intracellular proteinase inhibitor BsuPI domain-containing protein n=1 Tax=Actinorhabdospora filicis TaxID=1785913 RepID=A0A9W6W4G8_9ACTN|nr:hypothetical protein [Actinorhabdospora filicis]GLZ79252.1 hypothetical protein Afil01_40590 [Actinorhabdospora filicis]